MFSDSRSWSQRKTIKRWCDWVPCTNSMQILSVAEVGLYDESWRGRSGVADWHDQYDRPIDRPKWEVGRGNSVGLV